MNVRVSFVMFCEGTGPPKAFQRVLPKWLNGFIVSEVISGSEQARDPNT
jgi:hypothetical protein